MNILIIVFILFSGVSFVFYGLSLLFSTNMQVEFKRFGLEKFRKITGILQLLGGLGILIGLLFTPILLLSAFGLSLLMLLGFGVRLKVKDGFWVSIPSFFFFLLNLYIFVKVLVLNYII